MIGSKALEQMERPTPSDQPKEKQQATNADAGEINDLHAMGAPIAFGAQKVLTADEYFNGGNQ